MKYLSKLQFFPMTLMAYGLLLTQASPSLANPDRHEILIHPFVEISQGFSLNAPQTFHALQARPQSGSAAINKVVQAYQLDQRVQIRQRDFKPAAFWLNRSLATSTFHFEVDGIPLCQFEVKTHLSPTGYTIVLGDLPAVKFPKQYHLSQWPDLNATLKQVQQHAVQNQSSQLNSLKIAEKQACLWIHEGQVFPSWQLDLTSDDMLHYRAVATNSQVFDWQPRYFHITGKASIYERSPLDGQLTEFELRELYETTDGGCYLENPYFFTLLDKSRYQYAFASDCNFVFDASSSQFYETSLFTNANRTLEWLEGMGYTNFGSNPIKIVVHAEFNANRDTNNALYQPINNSPTIYVGDGDGELLQNLAIDADVISHELGHHVVFHTVTNISGESLVLHEGLADFLTFARTGDPCLGSSICPENSGVCAVPNQCLRSAVNDYRFGSALLPNEPHLRSQFISGMLWDLITKDQIPTETLTKMVLKSINLFVANSGYKHLILALMVVDDTDFEGQYCSRIYNRAIDRGLDDYIRDMTCDKIPSLIPGNIGSILDNEIPGPPNSGVKSRSSNNDSWCGNVGFPAQGAWSLLLMLALPCLAIFWRE